MNRGILALLCSFVAVGRKSDDYPVRNTDILRKS